MNRKLTPARASLAAMKPLSLALSALLVFGGVPALCGPTRAYAETDDIYAEADAAQQQVEQTSAAYDEAVATLDELDASIAENEDHLRELNAQIEAQQSSTDAAFSRLYKMQQEGGSLLSMLLCASSFHEFLETFDYIIRIQDANLRAINEMAALKSDLTQTQESLTDQREQASAQADAAAVALEEAKAAREAAQAAAKAAAEAEAQAAAEAAAKAAEEEAAQKAAEEAAAESGEEESSGDSGESSSESSDSDEGESASAPDLDEVDWSTDKAAFVDEWAPRIDDYLSGSPLSGQGETFAAAAWDYGVDPRFSPAISCVESSKGLYCFRSHNAWGWGSVEWDSWEEAIDAHVRGLARGYGYTVTIDGAKKYCPPTWEHWYTRVSEEMAKI